MKNYLSCRSTSARALLALVLLTAGGCLGVKAASFHPEATNTVSQRTLTFADRVAYQRAVEEVYWQHRIWPKENPRPKPSLDEVMSQEQIEQKVAEYLRNSQLLADQWQQPITPEQLQAEINRMATHTKQPQVLRELFAALGNDPFIVAECLARPILSQRLIGELYTGASPLSEPEFLGSSVANTGTEFSVTTNQLAVGYYLSPITGLTVENSTSDWVDSWVATNTNDAPDARYFHTAVWTGTEMIVWGGEGGSGSYLNTGGTYDPSTDSWTATSLTGAPIARYFHTAVWTGTEMIVWGGYDLRHGNPTFRKSGGRYNPSTDSWVSTTQSGTPPARSGHTAVWTGTEMIVWGGHNDSGGLNTGGRYNPNTNTWVATNIVGTLTKRYYHTSIWTGSEMIVWGGYDGRRFFNDGGRYNPSTNNWIAASVAGAPDARAQHTAVWTGSEMIVWGGDNNFGFVNTGGRYSPSTDSWVGTTTVGAPDARGSHTAVWTGSEMIIWGGANSGGDLNTGGRYSP